MPTQCDKIDKQLTSLNMWLGARPLNNVIGRAHYFE